MARAKRKLTPQNGGQKTAALWLMMGLAIFVIYHFMSKPAQAPETIQFSEFLQGLQQKQVASVSVQGETYHGKFVEGVRSGKYFSTMGPVGSDEILRQITDSGAQLEFQKPEEGSFWTSIFLPLLPTVLLFGFFFFSLRQMQSGGGKAMSFGRSKAKLLVDNQKQVTFKDVAGVEEAKTELEEIIAFLKEPKKFTKLGGRIPKGVLLMGSPGTGKTLLARAVAGEAGVPFFSISGSDFVEMFVGVGASRVRDLFEQGKKNAPCIIFIDEIDAVGRHRGAGIGGGHDEREQTLNQLLVEMDGFESNEGVIIMAATNRPDVLDPALMRPGRFDRRVMVPRPDLKGREQILQVHARKKPLAPDVDLSVLARGTPGFSGADLENVMNEAALSAARFNQTLITRKDFDMAKDKVMMGSERRSMVINDEEKRNTAYHEAGHALVAKLIPGTDPVHKVTIIPRGMALGLTQQLPTDERYTHNKGYLEKMIAILMGGRAAEELVFQQPTSGAGNDIERATDLAHKMVCEWGMSPLGPLAFGKHEEPVFLGREAAPSKSFSDDTAREIDREIRKVVQEQYDRALSLLKSHRQQLDWLAEALLEFETLDMLQIEAVMRGEKIVPPAAPQTPPPAVTPKAKAEASKPTDEPLFGTVLPEPGKA